MNGDEQQQQYHEGDGEQQQQGGDEQPQQQAEEAQPVVVADGYFSRVNGGMIQSGKYDQHIVSLIGQIISHDTIRTADGSTVQVNTEHLATEESAETEGQGEDGGGQSGSGSGLIVDPNEAVEIMGQVTGPTEITVRVYLCCCCCCCCCCSFVFVFTSASTFVLSSLVSFTSFFVFACKNTLLIVYSNL
jgi:hypothetical protein